MNKICCTVILFCCCCLSFAQNVAINDDASAADNSAILDIKSSSKGLLIPRMTSALRSSLAAPANGLMVFDTDTKSQWIYKTFEGWIEQTAFNVPYSKQLDQPFGTLFTLINNSNFFNSTAIRGNSAGTGVWGSGTGLTSRGIFGEGTVANAVGIWGKSYETLAYASIDYNTAIAGQASANIAVGGYAKTGIGIKGKAEGAGGKAAYFEGLSGAQALLVNGNSQFDGSIEINGIIKADGGLEVNGALTVSGSPGLTKQVLTSNGPGGTPGWTNAAFSNTTRFKANATSNTDAGTISFATGYNLAPADVTIAPTGITINKAGLYHFEVFYSYQLDLTIAPSYTPLYNLVFMGRSIVYYKPMAVQAFNTRYRLGETISIEQYIYAGEVLSMNFNTLKDAPTSSASSQVLVTGHLISE